MAQAEQVEKPMPAAAKVFDILFTVFIYLLSAAILVSAVLFAFNTSPDKSLFGYRYYTVLTPSMSPAYNVGDMIFVRVGNIDDIQVGDVITFNPSQDSEAFLTHRVSEKIVDYQGTGVTCFRTKGDANNAEDSFLIDEERVIGKVIFGVPVLGYIVRFVQLRWYFVLPIVIMIAVFLFLLKRYFLMSDDDEDEDGQNKADEDGKETGKTAIAAEKVEQPDKTEKVSGKTVSDKA